MCHSFLSKWAQSHDHDTMFMKYLNEMCVWMEWMCFRNILRRAEGSRLLWAGKNYYYCEYVRVTYITMVDTNSALVRSSFGVFNDMVSMIIVRSTISIRILCTIVPSILLLPSRRTFKDKPLFSENVLYESQNHDWLSKYIRNWSKKKRGTNSVLIGYDVVPKKLFRYSILCCCVHISPFY